ncbi:hypothetical protein Gotur_022119 [Gossypium turneri]
MLEYLPLLMIYGIWENQYDHIPTREPIIVLELAWDYMSWFRIHDKPYLLSKEKRCRQINGVLQQEPINSTHTITRPNASSDDAHTTSPSDYARCVS